jgi:hypothetical protein
MSLTNTLFNATVLCSTSVLWFFLLTQMKKKVKRYNKIEAPSHSEVQNVGSSIYTDVFAVNTTTQVMCNSQYMNETNITTTFII